MQLLFQWQQKVVHDQMDHTVEQIFSHQPSKPLLQVPVVGQAVQEQPPVCRPSQEDGRQGDAVRQDTALRGRLQVRRGYHRDGAAGGDASMWDRVHCGASTQSWSFVLFL